MNIDKKVSNIEKNLYDVEDETMVYNSWAKKKCIRAVISLSRKSIERDKSFWGVLQSQIISINKISWILHIILICFVSFLVQYCIKLPKNPLIYLLFAFLGPILQLAAIPEILASYRYKVWQIEQCTVVSLSQIVIVRIAIWQSINFIYILGLSLVLHNSVEIINIIIYIFIPYNLSNAISFSILQITKKSIGNVMCFITNFMLMIIYYVGTLGKLNKILTILFRTLMNHFFVFWIMSLLVYCVSIIALYRNILSARRMNYELIN